MRRVRFALVAAALLACQVPTASAGKVVVDLDHQDFETQTIPFSLIGTPDSNLVNAAVSITSASGEVKNGQQALKFAYELNKAATPTLLDSETSLRDLVSIRFWIMSEGTANWIIFLQDLDGASFYTAITLSPGVWQQVTLTPEDFLTNPGAANGQQTLDTGRLGDGFMMLDARNKYGPAGQANVVLIDDLVVERTPFELIEGDYVVSGTADSIAMPTSIRGDLIVENGARLDITASRFQVEGNVTVRDGSVLQFQNGVWQFLADYPKQYLVDVSGGSDLIFADGNFEPEQIWAGEVKSDSRLRFDTVRNGIAGATFNLLEGSTLELERAEYIGEFILGENTRSVVRNSLSVPIWINCRSAIPEPMTLPDGGHIDSWVAPAAWGREITIENTTDTLWNLLVMPGCDLQLWDSEVYAAGMTYHDAFSPTVSLDNLQPNLRYASSCITPLPTSLEQNAAYESSLCLFNSLVQVWNLYTVGSLVLDVTDSTLGEVIAFDDSQLNLANTDVDGTGGYLGSRGQARVRVVAGTITADLRAYGTSELSIIDSSITGDIYATDSAVVTLENTPRQGEVRTFGDASFTEF